MILGGYVNYPLAQGPAVLRHYRAFMQTAPDDVGTYARLAAGLLTNEDQVDRVVEAVRAIA